MTEPEFVTYLQQAFPFGFGMGIGDDTSVVKLDPMDGNQLITKDILIENVHFRLSDISLEDLALKSLAVNLSDIAAMGGEPLYFYLGLGFPKSMPMETSLDFFKGLEKGCKKWNIQLAGGDFSVSSIFVISITMIGKGDHPVYRHTAKAGDLIGLAGPTGESAIGLQLLLKGENNDYFINKHLHVEPQLNEGKILSLYVNSMIDVSDGLLMDLKRILTASKKGAIINYNHLPVSSSLKKICMDNHIDEHKMVLAGGEDYVLLFTISKEQSMKLKNVPLQCYFIGEIVDDQKAFRVEVNGEEIRLARIGYDHFLIG